MCIRDSATIEYPSGTNIEKTREGYKKLDEAARTLEKQLDNEFPDNPSVKNILSTLGWQPMRSKSARGPGNLAANFAGSNMAEVAIELTPGEDRSISTEEVVRRWRSIMPEVIGAKEVNFASSLFSVGDALNIQLSSKYIEELLYAKDELKEKLLEFPGVLDIKDNYNVGKEEINIILLPAATNYGINMMMVANLSLIHI